MKKIAIFASGSGSNAENIYKQFLDNEKIEVSLIVCNNRNAYVIDRFTGTEVEISLIKNREMKSHVFLKILFQKKIDLIVLAGFLALIPSELINEYPNKIINIHPALLPKYGGKGMYGDRVHKAVLDNKEKEHGITIHYVNEKYDEGKVIFQEKFFISDDESLVSIKEKVHQIEFKHYPQVIENILF